MHFVHIHRNILILIAFNRLTYCYFFIQVILFSTCNYNSITLNLICSSCSTFNNLGESAGMTYRRELYLIYKNISRTITPLHLQKTIKSIKAAKEQAGEKGGSALFSFLSLPQAAWSGSCSCLYESQLLSPRAEDTGPIRAANMPATANTFRSVQSNVLNTHTHTGKKFIYIMWRRGRFGKTHQEVLCKLNIWFKILRTRLTTEMNLTDETSGLGCTIKRTRLLSPQLFKPIC